MQECKLVKVHIHVGVKLFVDQCPKTEDTEDEISCVP
jgi:hypothetical protein